MALLVPLGVVAGNIGLFLATSSAIVFGFFGFSHHWLFPLHEAVLLLQVLLFRPPRIPVRALTGLSLLVLGVAAARLETIYLSHHLLQFSLSYLAGSAIHFSLYLDRKNPWMRINRGLAIFCAVASIVSVVIAWRHGIWWGLRE